MSEISQWHIGAEEARDPKDRHQTMPSTGTLLEDRLAQETSKMQIVAPHLGPEYQQACQHEDAGTDRGPGDRPPLAPGQQRDRNQQPKLRFVDHDAEQDAGNEGTPADQAQSAAEERRRPGAVLPAIGVHEHGRRREREQECVASRQRQSQGAPEAKPSGDQPRREAWKIRHHRERGGQDQQDGRIGIQIDLDLVADDALLKRVVDRPVVDFGDAAVPGQIRARPVIDVVIAERAAVGIKAATRIPQNVVAIEEAYDDNPGPRNRARQA